MLAERGIPRSIEGWAAEPTLDAWRARVLADDGQVRLRTRSGRDISDSVRSVGRLADRRVVLDGELVAEAGTMTDFYAVGPALARRRAVTFVAFDVLWLDGELLTSRPQQERRRILDGLALPVPVIPAFPHDDAPTLFQACGRLGVEGIVLKQLTALYRPGQRSAAWRKVKVADWRPHFERRFAVS
jgi:bifunctional non-homologous end joining protein LigD